MDNAADHTLSEMGFSSMLVSSVQHRMQHGARWFHLPDKVMIKSTLLHCVLDFNYDPGAGTLTLVQYEAMLQVDLNIEHLVNENIDSRQLEKQMQSINWNGREFTRAYLLQYGRLDEEIERKLQNVLSMLQVLAGSGEQGVKAVEQLQLTYWFDSLFNHEYMDYGEMDRLCRTYFPLQFFKVSHSHPTTAEAFEMLSRSAERKVPRGRRLPPAKKRHTDGHHK